MEIISDINIARQYISQGLIIAYPTEAIYGLGCDAFNDEAVKRLLAIKKRPASKGVIVLISSWQQLESLIDMQADIDLTKVKASWPGHTTWVFPKSQNVSNFVSGGRNTIAIRMSEHEIARNICKNTPVVSTSANITSEEPAVCIEDITTKFENCIDGVALGGLGVESQPSSIYDVVTGEKLR